LLILKVSPSNNRSLNSCRCFRLSTKPRVYWALSLVDLANTSSACITLALNLRVWTPQSIVATSLLVIIIYPPTKQCEPIKTNSDCEWVCRLIASPCIKLSDVELRCKQLTKQPLPNDDDNNDNIRSGQTMHWPLVSFMTYRRTGWLRWVLCRRSSGRNSGMTILLAGRAYCSHFHHKDRFLSVTQPDNSV